MKKDKNGIKETDESVNTGNGETAEAIDSGSEESTAAENSERTEFDILKAKIEETTKQSADYLNLLQRTAAEFENYKKRTIREKEALYAESVSDVVAAFLPVIDNLERALQACSTDNDIKVLREGVDLVYRQFKDSLKKTGVEEIKCVDDVFDPRLHNAVMHIEDENYGHNIIVEEFQKGYIYKEKVIRHSMVKVAN